MDDLLTVKDVAQKLKVSTDTVRELIYNGKLQGIKLGEGKQGAVRISTGSLTLYVKERPIV